MEIKNSIVTFWFQKQPNPKEYIDVLNEKLKEYFFEFSTIGVPANMDPAIPRMCADSGSSHSNVQISQISARLNTDFDDKYSSNCDMCIEYIEERALKIFEALLECGISTIYSAIFINLEEKSVDPAKKIIKYFLKNDDRQNINEVGIRLTETIDGKYYKCMSVNNGQQVKIRKVFESEREKVIFPLISLNDAEEVEDYLITTVEVNDKFSFNIDSNYTSNENNLKEMFTIISMQVKEELSRFNK